MALEEAEILQTNVPSDHGKTVLILNIDIGGGLFDQLVVCEEDEPIDLARAFCLKHGLGSAITRSLTQHIEHNIDELIREQCELTQRTARRNSQERNSRKPAPNSVFEKLHKLAKRPQTAKQEPKSLSPKKKPVHTNQGHKLYYKGLRAKETLEQKRQEVRKQEEDHLNQSLTFRPQINKKSSEMAARGPNHRPEDDLMRKGKRVQERIDRKREEQRVADVAGLTFTPGINTRYDTYRSAKLAVRSRSQDTFRTLYEDSFGRKGRLEETFTQHQTNECPFKPNINTTRDLSEDPVEVRLMKYKQQSEEELERTREFMSQLKDEETGQAFFRPKTGRSPRKIPHKKDSSSDVSFQGSPKKSSELAQSMEWKYTQGHSEELFLRRKLDRLQYIFKSLNPDASGRLTATSTIVENLETHILRVIAPLLGEMESQDLQLSFPDFADAMENLMKILTPEDRAVILGFGKKLPVRETPRHRPDIKPYKFSRAYEDRLSQPLYDRLLSAKKATEAKVKEEKDKKFQAEMAECSFRPKLQTHFIATTESAADEKESQ